MNKKVVLLLILFSLFTIRVDAQQVTQNEKLLGQQTFVMDTLTMDAVVVTGTRSKRSLKNVPILTQLITEKQIRATGMSKLEDVLSSQLPGLEFHQAAYGTSMTFQGLDARNILILVDGERLSGDTNGNIDFSKIPTEAISRIEVVKGSSSVMYGSNSMGATINIITKRPYNGLEGSAYVNFGGFNQINKKDRKEGMTVDMPNITSAAYLGYNSQRFVTTTDITYQSIDPYRLVSKHSEKRHYLVIDGKPVDKYIYVPVDSSGISVSGWQSVALNQKLEYKISEHLTARLKGGYYWKNRYDLGNYKSFGSIGEDGVVPFENYQGYNIDAYLNYSINKNNNLDFSFHTTNTTRHQDSLGLITPKQDHNVMVGRVLYKNTSFKNNELTVGMDFFRETLKLDLSSGGFGDKYFSNTFSLYVQDEAKLSNVVEILAGVRLDNYGFTSAEEMFNNIFAPDKNKDKQGMGFSVIPQLGLKFDLNKFKIRANYAMGFRNPSLKERYMEYYQPYMGLTITGNADLKPETNNFVSVSGDYLSSNNRLYMSLNAYANFFRDKIDTYHDVQELRLIYQNTAKSNLYGVDFATRLMILKGWWFNANYSFSYRDESGPVNSAQYIFASPHTVSLLTNYMFEVKKWTLGVNFSANYYSPKTYQDMMPTIINNSGSLIPEIIEGVYEGNLEGYVLCNLSFNAILNHKWNFSAGVNNMFNYTPSIASFNSAVTPGITGFVSLRMSF